MCSRGYILLWVSFIIDITSKGNKNENLDFQDIIGGDMANRDIWGQNV